MNTYEYNFDVVLPHYLTCNLIGPMEALKRELRKARRLYLQCEHISLLEALDSGKAIDEANYRVRLKINLSDFDGVFRLFCWLRALTEQDLQPLTIYQMTPVSEICNTGEWHHTFKIDGEEIFRATSPFIEPFFNLIINEINLSSLEEEQPECDPQLLEDKLPEYDHRLWPPEDSTPIIRGLEDEIDALKGEQRLELGQFEQGIDARLDRVRKKITLIEKQANLLMYPYTGKVNNFPHSALRRISHTLEHNGQFIDEHDPRIKIYRGFESDIYYPLALEISVKDIEQSDCILTNRRYFILSDDGASYSGPNDLEGVPHVAMPELVKLGTKYHALREKLERLQDEKYLEQSQMRCTVI
jgi:hypothetical protein